MIRCFRKTPYQIIKRFFHHSDLITQLNQKKILFKEGFQIKSFQFTYPPPNCVIEIDEVEQLTQGLKCDFKNTAHRYPSEISITFQNYPGVLQDLHQEPPPEVTQYYRWNGDTQEWQKLD